ncbi:MAG: hypothetical protein IKB70_12640 [Bacilli bacterium]|nr:hypothetical protein [Bacilli bacterium]
MVKVNLSTIIASKLKEKEMDKIKGGQESEATGCTAKCGGDAKTSANEVTKDIKNHVL